MGLQTYHHKRDFSKTPEPRGRKSAADHEPIFVVQKHAASRLHYDLRLELGGVLKSWAVPKGPSLDPGERRLAVHVEDHPLEYASFEGSIPEGEYGGGEVIVWDRGTWSTEGSAAKALKKGKLTFELHGEKLNGGWTLARMGGRQDEDNWLLIKRRDAQAAAEAEDIVEARPESVVSGKTISEKPKRKRARTTPADFKKELESRLAASGAAEEALPREIAPQLATSADAPPQGERWLHELKYDGYRLLTYFDHSKVRLISRNGKDWTKRFAPLAEELRRLPVSTAVLDGEACVLDESGAASFQALQNYFRTKKGALAYYVFDLLHIDGYNVRSLSLEERKELLKKVLGAHRSAKNVVFNDHFVGEGPEFLSAAAKINVEGIVSKRRDSPYRSGRNESWLKVKREMRQEFVVGGYKRLKGGRQVGALLLGYYEDGNLVYAGKVGTGFTDKLRKELFERFASQERKKAPFDKAPKESGAHWVSPKDVVEVTFSEWTGDGRLRAPVYRGLREDKAAKDVSREVSAAAAKPTKVSTVTKGSAEVKGVVLTHADRVLFPEQGVSKRELAEYYLSVADRMLPDLVGRPLTLVRCPRGREKDCFFQKHGNDSVPDSVPRIKIPGDDQPYLTVQRIEDLLALVQISALEIHTWNCRSEQLDKPDRMVFDLDPGPGVTAGAVKDCARLLRDALDHLELKSFLRVSGGKGLHVVVPLLPEKGWDEVKEFSKGLAEAVVRADPASYVATASKAKRKGKIFIDYLRNGWGATSIASYSVRARAGAPIAVPIGWDELTRLRGFDQYNLKNIARRLARLKSDPWQDYEKIKQKLGKLQ